MPIKAHGWRGAKAPRCVGAPTIRLELRNLAGEARVVLTGLLHDRDTQTVDRRTQDRSIPR